MDSVSAPAVGRSWSDRARLWRSPADQPTWARPGLLVVTALAALSYCWRTGSTIEIYYAAAVRSMASSWHDFVFGAFDPAATVSVDKLPGALWVQALSVRVFGFHAWSLLVPQAVEGAATVLVLFHVVRRLAGPGAGLVAAIVMAASPSVTTLDRGNIPDSLMILLLVLAADSMVTAVLVRRWQSVAMTGLWVGLAFQAKMLEAWLVLPAFALTYLVAADGDIAKRIASVALLGAVAVIVSLTWMTFVSISPAQQRPYVDGSATDSVYQQVFEYDGFSRLGTAPPDQVLGRTLGTPLFAQSEPPPTWDRLLGGSYGRDTGWLLPAALLIIIAVVGARWRQPRTDRLRAGIVLWGTWLVILAVVFTISTAMNSYYAAALAPAVAALAGIGVVSAWEHRRQPVVPLLASVVVLVTIGYAAWLLPSSGTGLPAWLSPAVVVVGVGAVMTMAVSVWLSFERTPFELATDVGLVIAGLAVLATPVVASASAVADSLGPFDTPFQPATLTTTIHTVFAPQLAPPGLARLEASRQGAPYLMATQTSALAAPYVYATGQEVLPLGGYTGTVGEPSIRSLEAKVANGRFHIVLMTSPRASPSATWVAQHCRRIGNAPGGSASVLVPHLSVYFCGG